MVNRKKATVKDVAKLANVSIATVSRYINNVGFISGELKSKIERAIKELDYYPNKIAQNFSKGRTGTVGIIIPDISNPFFPELVRGVSDFLFGNNLHVHLLNSDNDPDKEELFLKDLQSMWVDGIIIAPSDSENRNFNLFNQIQSPKVILDREIIGLSTDLVVVNNKKGSFEAVKYLISNGHRSIVFLGGLRFTLTAQKRYSGWMRALTENHIYDKDYEFWGEYSIDSGYRMMQEVFEKIGKVDAVFACNDLISLGAMQAVEERKYKMPDDISIVGFDDIYLSKFLKPPLTTVRQPTYEMGETAARLLLSRIENNEEYEPEKIVVEGQLIIRGSVAKRN
jgi:LacI family transcriptional regulator